MTASTLVGDDVVHADRSAFRDRWAPGDVVVWDNARVMHRADHADVVGDRTFHRGMVSAAAHHT